MNNLRDLLVIDGYHVRVDAVAMALYENGIWLGAVSRATVAKSMGARPTENECPVMRIARRAQAALGRSFYELDGMGPEFAFADVVAERLNEHSTACVAERNGRIGLLTDADPDSIEETWRAEYDAALAAARCWTCDACGHKVTREGRGVAPIDCCMLPCKGKYGNVRPTKKSA
jgi:hypothetical protein